MTWKEYRYYFVRGWQQELCNNSGCCGPVLIILAVIFFLVSCRTIQYVPVETVRTEYKTKTDTFIQKDSVHVKDSVLVRIQGDTVHYHHWHYEYIGHSDCSVHNDTVVVRDTTRLPVPVERKLTKWESFCIDYGKVMVGVTVAVLLILIFLIARWMAGYKRKE